MISTAWAAPWASACMSSASLIVIPSKPSSPRSVPSNTARDRVAGRVGSPVSPGTAMCEDMTVRAPAAIAARNGTSSCVSMSWRLPWTTPRPWWVSSAAAPSPGKCLIDAATPADWSPRTIAAPCRATAAGSLPNERIPRAAFVGSVARSSAGA